MSAIILNPEIGTTDCTDDTDFKALGTRVQLTQRVSGQGTDHHRELSESVSSVVLPIAVSRIKADTRRGSASSLNSPRPPPMMATPCTSAWTARSGSSLPASHQPAKLLGISSGRAPVKRKAQREPTCQRAEPVIPPPPCPTPGSCEGMAADTRSHRTPTPACLRGSARASGSPCSGSTCSHALMIE